MGTNKRLKKKKGLSKMGKAFIEQWEPNRYLELMIKGANAVSSNQLIQGEEIMNVIAAYIIEKERLSREIAEKTVELYMSGMSYEEALEKAKEICKAK